MEKVIAIIFFLFISYFSFSQEVLLEQDSITTIKETKFGKNKKHYSHLYYGVHFITPPNNVGSALIYGSSYAMEYGYRYKYRIARFYSVGTTISYNNTRYELDQNAIDKITPDTEKYNEQLLRIHELRLGLYSRINWDKRRGNYIGRFIDLGMYGGYNFGAKHRTEIKEGDSKYIATHTRLNYIEKLNYGVFANLGFNRYVFTFNYRLSDVFTVSSGYPEMPVLMFGFQLGLHK